ncbi:unnamed protein product [Trichobilharzia regenti]|nr:unnamed protein product [Trichobilharzia regenti]
MRDMSSSKLVIADTPCCDECQLARNLGQATEYFWLIPPLPPLVFYFKLQPTLSRRFWLYTESDGTKQVGGFWKMFEGHGSVLVYATVRGAGHMVPGDKPAAAFHLINKFIHGENL